MSEYRPAAVISLRAFSEEGISFCETAVITGSLLRRSIPANIKPPSPSGKIYSAADEGRPESDSVNIFSVVLLSIS